MLYCITYSVCTNVHEMYRYLVIRAAKYFRPGELCRTSQAIEYYLKLIISVCALKIKYADCYGS